MFWQTLQLLSSGLMSLRDFGTPYIDLAVYSEYDVKA